MHDLESWLEELRESKDAIIVEGKKDKQVLEEHGVKNIFTLNKPIYKLVEEIALHYKSCIILVDLDKEGRKLYKSLRKNLEKYKVKINDKFRNFLFRHTKIRQLESLDRFIEEGL